MHLIYTLRYLLGFLVLAMLFLLFIFLKNLFIWLRWALAAAGIFVVLCCMDSLVVAHGLSSCGTGQSVSWRLSRSILRPVGS